MNGGSSIDAVEAAIRSLEVDPFFNAAYGGALTSEGEVEMDAILMDGSDGPDGREPLNVGAVAGVMDIMHPITLARRVMEKTEYNFLSAKGAMELARKEGFSFLPPGTLVTQRALDILEEWRQEQKNMTMKRRVGEGGTVG
jgi:L-asparaginase / beta-aspartyl-peptidase